MNREIIFNYYKYLNRFCDTKSNTKVCICISFCLGSKYSYTNNKIRHGNILFFNVSNQNINDKSCYEEEGYG